MGSVGHRLANKCHHRCQVFDPRQTLPEYELGIVTIRETARSQRFLKVIDY